MSYRNLRAPILIERIELLQKRIYERFPERQLNKVCAELLAVTKEAQARADWIARPHWWLRLSVGLVVVMLLGVAGGSLWVAAPPIETVGFVDLIQAVEAGTNNLLLIGAAVAFLITTEQRMKQKRALNALHELRSLAHVIDMYQLTKDPERVLGRGPRTPSSPKEMMTPFELTRYLDYCSEMLSFIGKIAALYVQEFDDPVAVAAVNEVEDLTTSLSRKIWQKIMVLHNAQIDQEQQKMMIAIAKK